MTTLQYPCGQPIPENTVAALRFLGKTGALGRETWERFFATGRTRWRKRAIGCLVERGYLRPHANSQAQGTFVLGEKGIALLERYQWSRVSPVPVSQLGHDRTVVHGILALHQAGILQAWVTERELIRDQDRHYLVQKKDRMAKYPDAILKLEAFGKPITAALEYEANRKAHSRYRAILRAYAGMADLSMVLFVCRSRAIQKAIENGLKSFEGTALIRRVAFADAEEWVTNPATAALQIRSGTIRLGELCARASPPRAA